MSGPVLTAAAQEVLRERIESFEELEILLLLRAERSRAWSVDEVAEWLRVTAGFAEPLVEKLRARDLIALRESEGARRYVYGARAPELDAAVAEIACAYETNRHEILRLMSANAIERVRTSAMRAFADAFLVGRKKHG